MADGDDATREATGPAVYRHAPDTLTFRKLRKRILRQVQEAIRRYGMDVASASGEPARWLVCLSGGKDSYAPLAALLDLKWQGALKADIVACNLDQGQPGFPKDVLPSYLESIGVRYGIETRDTYSVVTEKIPEGRTYCSLCSRLRRGNLYRVAREEGCQAVVLGHHRDDALETFLMNFFHGGRLAAMPPKLLNDEGDLLVLRPLILSAEKDIAHFSRLLKVPIIPCDLCGSQEGLQRAGMKALLDSWEARRPGQRDIMFKALQNVRTSHLADDAVFDFEALLPKE
jgi:tRNA 2-thiocytidine biosynthesis protein TtcA